MTQDISQRGLLLVETDVKFRDELSIALQRFGISMVWRARVLGLLEAIADVQPIAVVLSGDLPGGEPIDIVRAIRAQQRWADLPVYVVSSELSREDELKAFVAGADAVLPRAGAVPEIAARTLRRVSTIEGEPPRDDTAGTDPGRALADAALELSFSQPSPAEDAEAAHGGNGAPSSSPFKLIEDTAPTPDSVGATTTPPVASHPAGASGAVGPTGGASSPALDPPETAVPIGVSRPALPSLVPGVDPTGVPIRPATIPVVPDVIIVEDDPSLLEMLRYALTNRGYQTLSFSNGLDALRSMREMDTAGRHPVVLLDVDLPGIDGFRILHELSSSRPGDYQVILCTVHNSEATQVLGIQSGALDYLVKPLRMPIVLAKVERLVGRGSFTSATPAEGLR